MLRRKSWELPRCQKRFFSVGFKTSFFQYLFRSPLQPAGKWPFQEIFTGGNFSYSVLQGHKRKNWKVRRFVLRADPAFLHYYDPTKVCEWGVTTPRNPLTNLNIIMKIQLCCKCFSHPNLFSGSSIHFLGNRTSLALPWEVVPCKGFSVPAPCLLSFPQWGSFSLAEEQKSSWDWSFAVPTQSGTTLLQGFFLRCDFSGLTSHHLRVIMLWGFFTFLFQHRIGFPWCQSIYRNFCYSVLNLLRE